MSLKTKSRHSRLNTNNYPKKSVPAKCPRLPRFNSVRAPPASSNSTCLKQTDEKEEEEEEEPTSIFAQAQPTNQRSDKTTLCLDGRAERTCNFYIRESEVRKNHHQFHHEGAAAPLASAVFVGGTGLGGTEEGQQEGRRAGRGQGGIQPLHVRSLKILKSEM